MTDQSTPESVKALADEIEQASNDALRAACGDDWYVAVSALCRACDGAAEALRILGASHD